MRTPLLSAAALLLCGSLFAQKTPIPVSDNATHHIEDMEYREHSTPSIIREKVLETELVDISSASNIFTILNVDQNQVHYSPELDVLSFVHRQDVGDFSEGGSGTVRYDMSMDQGASWDLNLGAITPELVNTDGAIPISTVAGEDLIYGCRYPNGMIYNPPGNTDINNARYVSTGPCLFSTLGDVTGWGVSYYASQQLDGSDAEDQYLIYLPDSTFGGIDYFPTSLVQGGEAVHAIGDNGTGGVLLIWKGEVNDAGDGFDWSMQQIAPDWKADGTGAIIYTGYQNMAFSADGAVGYAVFGGATTGQADSLFIPIVYTTIDQGETWSLASDDFEMGQTEIGALLLNRPYLRNFDCVVDGDGNLRLFAEVMQLSEDYSGFFYAGYMAEYIWDGSSWTETLIGVIDDTDEGVFQGNFQDLYTHPQASITADGSVAIYSWSSSLNSDINIQPDMFSRAVHTPTGYLTEIKNMTQDTDAEEFAYYITCSPTLITDGLDFEYEVPAVMFIDWTGNNLDPVQFYYLKGAGFDMDEFVVGLEDLDSPVSNVMLFPNPSSDHAYLNYVLTETTQTSMRVIDQTGRTVSRTNNKISSPGTYDYEIMTSQLDAGIYLVELSTGDHTKTMRLNVIK